MKFIRFHTADSLQIGVIDAAGTGIIPLPGALIPSGDLMDIVGNPAALAEIAAFVAAASGSTIALDSVKLAAPLTPRRNMFCVGKNYHAHAEEFHKSGFDSSAGANATPDAPIIFTKAPSAVIATGEPIPAYLDDTDSTDYEGELAVVIGTGGRGIAAADAMSHVFGYTIVNDVTARDLQQKHRQWFLGKSIDGFAPLGPCVVTADEIPDIGAMELRTLVDGEIRQKSAISKLIFDIPTLIETISKRITLMPGDIIATGTPEGVGIGFTPPRFLNAGEVVRIEIDGIGFIENTVAGAA